MPTLQSVSSVTSVTFLTSSQPGLGKTEYVKRMASKINCGVNTMLVAGPITKQSLIRQLRSQSTKKHYILHLDCADMTDSSVFDCFVFEIAVVGMSVSGTSMCISPSPIVILEISNTQRMKLQNSLPVCSSFQKKHIEWSTYDHFVVSEDINSPVQVVCHYLKALNDKTLDKKDITFVGSERVSPLSESECHKILKRHFSSDINLSYSLIETFLGLFSQELRRMAASSYFTSNNIVKMVEQKYSEELRSNFVREMMTVCKEFSARSVEISQAREINNHIVTDIASVSSESVVARMERMIMWHDTNHLFLVFHRQDSQSVTPVYQNRSKILPDIEHLFQSQMGGPDQPLPDYNKMSLDELQGVLEKIVRKNSLPFDKTKLEELQTGYALTPDNFLKMVLIYIRIQAQIPVIIMGETGCGKTSLIMYLARVCEVPFQKLNLHAGVTEDMIVDFIHGIIDEIKRSPSNTEYRWVFFDEINACDHLGLLNEIVCHHRCKGKYLPPNLVFIAACNPYRLQEYDKPPVGLRTVKTQDEISKLVYRVHPLPETMTEYVWDYGALNENDEEIYIKQMIGKEERAFVDLVVESQKFMRKHEGNSHCVSLRDVNRCKHLQHHFKEMFCSKKLVPIRGSNSGDFVNRKDIRSMVLSLCHCYHSRLSSAKDRKAYRQVIADTLARHNGFMKDKINDQHIDFMIKCEQLDLLKRMTIPTGTALNEALRENVFVMLVSILNNIPVFVVGKPGCSKSLAMQLIKNNLRGADSTDEYFKKLPPVYTISFQGSKSSTSEGIIKVFDKAKRYKDHNANVIPVVLLDEIGLAELSTFNPLKVLHSQLEPVVGEFPPVAVVGISNWALDSAKMNRAVHLSRPDPTELDLKETAESIKESVKRGLRQVISDVHIKGLAKAYYKYQLSQPDRHFHGLRDYYSFIKVISSASGTDPADIVINGLRRNFGGKKSDITTVLNTFLGQANLAPPSTTKPDVPDIMKLITDNISDLDARHLLLITRGDSALNILEQTLQEREHKIIYGSKFESDRTEQYKYQVLSEIILCMERGLILVMRDLDCIYESLYDMLNQSYTVVGRKRNCRVAIGAYSNPMCQVHDIFRCIVMVDENKLDLADPPFLNRFEKQPLTFSEILSTSNKDMVRSLRQWYQDLNIEESPYEADELFLGFCTDSLSSLVYKHLKTSGGKKDETQESGYIKECKRELLKTACPDAILRLTKSKLCDYDEIQAREIINTYFELPIHDGFCYFLQEHNTPYKKMIVYTHSSIHLDLQKCIGDLPVQVNKLSNFKSQLDLSNFLLQFWNPDAKPSVLVLQCMPSLDASNMTLMKCCIDDIQREYMKKHNGNPSNSKSVCIVVHLDRFQKRVYDHSWEFNFLCGWDQFTVDSLDSTTPVLNDIYGKDISEVLDMEGLEWQRIVDAKMLLWCFNCIKYTEKPRSVDNTLQLVHLILQSKEVMELLKTQVLKYLKKEELSKTSTETWQTEIACDRELLMTWSTLVEAMIEYIRHRIRLPLAKVIIFLEESNAWNGICIDPGSSLILMPGDQETSDYWKECFAESEIFNILHHTTFDPRGSETYPLARSLLNLKYPFFDIFKRVLDDHYQYLVRSPNASDEDGRKDILLLQLRDLISRIPKINHQFLTNHLEDFIYDLMNVFSETFAPNVDEDLRVEILTLLVTHIKQQENSDTETDPFQKIAEVYLLIQRNYQLLSAELLMISEYNKTGEDVKRLLEGLGTSENHVNCNDTAKQIQTESLQLSTEVDDTANITSDDLSANTTTDDNSISDENEIDSDADSENVTTTDEFHAILVSDICKAHIPFKNVLQHFGGIERWQQTTNSLINLAKQVLLRTSILSDEAMSSRATIFHFLSLCRDFATLIISMKLANQDELLSSLADLSLHTDSINVLDNKEIVEYLTEITFDREKKHISVTKRQEFMCMCFNLCLEANLDTKLLSHILETLCLESGNTMKGSTPVLNNILESEIEGNICEEIISIGTIDKDEFQNMYAVDKMLQRVAAESPFSVICCDIIEEAAFSHISWTQMEHVSSSEDQMLKTATKSADIVFGTTSVEVGQGSNSSMQYVCACAFLRVFIKCTGDFFRYKKNPQLFQHQKRHYVLATSVCSILSQASQQPNSCDLALYLLKCMTEYETVFEVFEWLKELPQSLQYLKELEFQPQLCTSRLGYNPLSYMTKYPKVINAISELSGQDMNKTKLLEVLQTAKSDTEYKLGIVSALSEIFYWIKTTTGLRNTDQETMTWIKTKIGETLSDPPCINLLHRLLDIGTQNDFLDINSTTNVRKLHQISVVIHVACLLIYEDSRLSLDSEVDFQISNSQPGDSLISIICFECPCGFSMFCRGMQTTCSVCHRDLRGGKAMKQSDTTTNSRKHVSQIQMILNVISDSLNIGKLLFCNSETDHNTVDIRSSVVSSTEHDSAVDAVDSIEMKYSTLENKWQSLEDTLDMNLADVSCLLHSILYNIISVSKANALPFQEFVCTMIRKILLDSNRYMKEYQHTCFTAQEVQEHSIEYQIEELPRQHRKDLHSLKPRLFRKRRCPSFKDFEMQVFRTTSDTSDFPFLRLFLHFKEPLQYVRHLPILLKWNAAITRHLGHPIKRVDAEKREISTLLDKSTNELFCDFQKAWNDISNGWGAISGSDKVLPTMTLNTRVIMCIMDTSEDDSPLYSIVHALQNVQNDFVKHTLSIASSVYSPSLNFLVKDDGVSTIQRVPLDKVREEIIDFKWSDKILQNCDNGTEYGNGCSLEYNFIVIERALARKLVMGKALLTEGTIFSQNVFSDELIHAPSSVLADIRSQIPQKSLSNDVLESLNRKIRESNQFARKFLDNLEIMFVLLKKTGGEPHDLLVKYIELWSTRLPGSFPSDILPAPSSIMLCHVEALYNELENHLANDYINCLESTLKHDLQTHMVKDLKLRLKGADVDQMRSAERMLRLFTFRYLRPSKNVKSETCNTSLMEVITKSTRGVTDMSALAEVIQTDICVRHIFRLQEFIGTEIQHHLSEKTELDVMDVGSPPRATHEKDTFLSTPKPSSIGRSKSGKGKRWRAKISD